MGYVIDRYKLNPGCVCLGCDKYRGARNDFSKYCDAYPKNFPPKIWNTENAQCEHFEPKHSDNQRA